MSLKTNTIWLYIEMRGFFDFICIQWFNRSVHGARKQCWSECAYCFTKLISSDINFIWQNCNKYRKIVVVYGLCGVISRWDWSKSLFAEWFLSMNNNGNIDFNLFVLGKPLPFAFTVRILTLHHCSTPSKS